MNTPINELFWPIQDVFKQFNCVIEPSEAHGIMIGAMSAGLTLDETSWIPMMLEQLNKGQRLPGEGMSLMSDLYLESRRILNQEPHALEILLDDESPLPNRLFQLSKWCEGFLLGFGLHSKDLKINANIREILTDFRDISQVEVESEASEELEVAFLEVFEHVRISVQIVAAEHAKTEIKEPPQIH
jgi:uncharacterized protein